MYYFRVLFITSQIWEASHKNKARKSEKMKEKFSVSIDEDLLKWVDSQIKSKIFASRSHGIEYALNELKKKKD